MQNIFKQPEKILNINDYPVVGMWWVDLG